MYTDTTDRPTYRLYIARQEALPDDDPWTPYSAERFAVAALTGATPGTTARLDRLTYPDRAGEHAYAAEAWWWVDGDGVVRWRMVGRDCPADGGGA